MFFLAVFYHSKSLLGNEENEKYAFYVNETEIKATLGNTIEDIKASDESVINVIYSPVAVFKVRPVTRCSTEMNGHAEAILATQFSPEGRYLASGSGDTTVRLWDLTTESPQATLEGHKDHVLVIAWAPNAQYIASGCKKGQIILWSGSTGKQLGAALKGHSSFITGLSWEPLHINGQARKFVSSSKDTRLIIWDAHTRQKLITLSNHSKSVTCCLWGGQGLIYSGSQDRTIGVWRPDGVYCRGLKGHAHWVNALAVNTQYVTRTGAFEPAEAQQSNKLPTDEKILKEKAKKRYDAFLKAIGGFERLCSGKAESYSRNNNVLASDDFTLYMWKPESEKKPDQRLTGHQATINDVKFSPDARYIGSGESSDYDFLELKFMKLQLLARINLFVVSYNYKILNTYKASFDKSVKLWCGKTGKFLAAFRGHVRPVYSLSFSADSRLIVTGSSDSTLKLFEIATRKLLKVFISISLILFTSIGFTRSRGRSLLGRLVT